MGHGDAVLVSNITTLIVIMFEILPVSKRRIRPMKINK